MANRAARLIHLILEGRSSAQIGRKGKSNRRWIVGFKFCRLINAWGGIVGWLSAPAHLHDTWFHPLIQRFQNRRLILCY